ncbi:MAG: DUF2065 family protein [Azospirillum sp.]|nr:DUF2065 family protein [Azospirillum sp.]
MIDFLTGIGLAIVIEGMLWAAFPDAMRKAVAMALSLPAGQLRMVGLMAASLGVAIVWLVRAAPL